MTNEPTLEKLDSMHDKQEGKFIQLAKEVGFSESEIKELDRLYSKKLEDMK